MKTTKQICKDNEVRWCDGYYTKWYSEDEIKKTIAKCYSYGHAEPLTDYYNEKDDNLICVAQLLELLFNAPNLNLKSSNEDSLNKGYEVNQE